LDPPNPPAFIPVSVILQQLHDEAPADRITLGWVLGNLQKRSFGVVVLLLGLIAMAPGVSFVAGLLLVIPAFEMILGRGAPTFPRRITNHSFPTGHLATLIQRAVPVMRYLENIIHPRWHVSHHVVGRVVGIAVLLLSSILIFVPIPLSNVIPAFVIALLALAWIEEDGFFLVLCLFATVLLSGLVVAAVWATGLGATWIGRLW
jgi:hypothetical protein